MNTKIIVAVVVVILIAVGAYFYKMNMTDSDMVKNTQDMSVVKSDSSVDNSTNPDDISKSIDNVDMVELDAQIEADMRDIDNI